MKAEDFFKKLHPNYPDDRVGKIYIADFCEFAEAYSKHLLENRNTRCSCSDYTDEDGKVRCGGCGDYL